MREKVVIGLMSALLGGALSAILDAANTAGRLTSIERAVERIETRLDSLGRVKP